MAATTGREPKKEVLEMAPQKEDCAPWQRTASAPTKPWL